MLNLLTQIPARPEKPRKKGLTMMMDKGLSLNQAKEFLETCSEYTDIIKLGFGTSLITPNIKNKIKLYQENSIEVYLGGTLFEAFVIRNQIEDYKKLLDNLNLNMVEISDGSINLNHKKKCNYIKDFNKNFTVLSEIGSKSDNQVKASDWTIQMKKELEAGSWKVIAEARESGNIGIFDNEGETKADLVDNIVNEINETKIIWETPKKIQQTWFINKFGTNVNLANISYSDIIPLETLRLGLRGDTLNNFITN
mgnify:FL=1